MSQARSFTNSDGKVIHLDRTYIIEQEHQIKGPILRVNEISKHPETGEPFKIGDQIKDTDFFAVADNKPQFEGWVGVKIIKDISTRVKPNTGSDTDGLKVQTIYV